MIGEMLRNKRLKRGMSQEKLARKANFNSQYLSKIERGRVTPLYSTVETLCDALGVEIKLEDKT